MNQILCTDKNKKNKGPANIKSIVLFFSICMIIFGVVLIGQGSFSLYTDSQKQPTGVKQELSVSIEREENTIILKAKSSEIITQLIYNWNNTEDITLLGKGRTEFEERIELPVGNNVLNIRIADVSGEQKTYQKQYVLEQNDIYKPEIEFAIIGNNVKIVARDAQAMSYMTYRWNEEEETTVNVRPESPNFVEVEIPIRKGQNTLTVIAVDNENNTEEKSQDIEGITRPVLELEKQEKTVKMRAADEDDGLERIEFTLNGQNYIIPFKNNEKQFEYTIPLPQGNNTLNISVYNKNGDVTTATQQIQIKNPILNITKKQKNITIYGIDDQVGIDRIEFTLNGTSYTLPLKNSEKRVQYTQALTSAQNEITIKLYNKNGEETSLQAKFND